MIEQSAQRREIDSMRQYNAILPALIITSAALLTGCDDDGDPSNAGPDAALPPPIDIVGRYVDAFDQPHVITATTWSQGPGESASLTTFTRVDNAERWAVGQNADDDPYNPGAWSRFHYTFDDARIWYCQSVYDAADEATALAAPAPDATDPAAGGCGDFAWSPLTSQGSTFLRAGDYRDGFDTIYRFDDTSITISPDSEPSIFVLTGIGTDYAITRNSDDNPYNPGAWSRFDFTAVDGDDFLYVCQSAFDAASPADARAASADRTAPSEGGCGMFPWSGLEVAR